MKGQTLFPHLFRNGRIGNLETSNRIVRSPCCTGLGGRDGTAIHEAFAAAMRIGNATLDMAELPSSTAAFSH